MKLPSERNQNSLFALSIIAFSFIFAGNCSATINKSTAAVVVSTKDQGNWYDLSDKGLHTFAVCDGSSSYDSGKYSFTTGCNSNSKHDDYLYTDTEDERNLNNPGKDFVIKASASASTGSVDKIKLEWIYGLDSVPSDGSWTNSANNPGSATCDDKGTCTFCIEGGKCDKPAIPKAALSVKGSGAQSRFHFRVTFVSSTGDSVTSGVDGTLSKFHSFVICGPQCNSCEDYAPSISLESSAAPSNWCNGLNDQDGYFTVRWKHEDMPSNIEQTYYKLSVRKLGTTSPVQTKEVQSSDTFAKVPSSWLSYGSAYEWQVTAKFEGQGCEWTVISPWSTSAMKIDVLTRYPIPKMKVTNQDGADCLSGGCKDGDTITLDGAGSSSFGLPPEGTTSGTTTVSYSSYCSVETYSSHSGTDGSWSSSSSSSSSLSFNWTMNKDTFSGQKVTQKLSYKESSSSSSSGNVPDKYKVKLSVEDCMMRTCSIEFDLKGDPDPEPKCDDGPDKVAAKTVKPASLCNGLNDTDGYYAVSWNTENMPSGAKQVGYEITLKDKSGTKADQTIKGEEGTKEGEETMVEIPTSMISYGNEYEVVVKTKIESANKKCAWSAESGKIDLAISGEWPDPEFIVNDGPTDCLLAVCETDKELTFDANSSKVYAGCATYDWIIESDSYSGATFTESFAEPKNRQVTLNVMDGSGNTCSITKELPMKAPECKDAPTVSISELNYQGDYCDGMRSFRLGWKIEPANFKQQGYELTVQNIGDASDNYIEKRGNAAEPYASTVSWIPTDEINWNSEYSWQVKVDLVSANGKCTYDDVSSLVSSGADNIVTPHEYPHPIIAVANGSGKNCLLGECLEGDTFEFYGGNSFASDPKSDVQYAWVLDGNARSGVQFSEQLAGVSHEVTLSVTDDYNQTCSSGAKTFATDAEAATNSKPSWTEIAPKYE
jgi:hypothetical protein